MHVLGARSIQEISVHFVQFYYKPEVALKI